MKTKLTSVEYLGCTAVDKRFSLPMLPWILQEIKRRGYTDKFCLSVENGCLLAYDVNFEVQFTHKLHNIIRFSQVQSSPTEFLYLLKDAKEQLLYCHLFNASTSDEVSELFGQMKELSHSNSLQGLGPTRGAARVCPNRGYLPTGDAAKTTNRTSTPQATEAPTGANPLIRSHSNAANLTSLCADISPCNSHFFEVLYIGKIKVSHKKVPETLIDDALSKFQQLDLDRTRAAHLRRNSLLSSQADSLSLSSEQGSWESIPGKTQHKKVEFAPLPLSHSKKSPADLSLSKEKNVNTSLKDGLQSPSLTPLTSNTVFFSETNVSSATKDDDDKTSEETKDKNTVEEDEDVKKDKNELEPNKDENKDIEKEFDELSAVRALKQDESKTMEKPLVFNKSSFPVALEPKVLVLNWMQNEEKNRMDTLDEDDYENSTETSSIVTDDTGSVPDIEKLISNIKLLGKSELAHSQTKTVPNQSILTSKASNKAIGEEKTKKNVEFKVREDVEEKLEKSSSTTSVQSESLVHSSGARRGSNDSRRGSIDMLGEKKSLEGTMPENRQFARDRSASIGVLNLKTPIAQLIGDQNRTMLFQVGRSDLRLISPDRKQVLLHRLLRDVSSCARGIIHPDHLGFICREPQGDSLVGYVFKCQSDDVACDVVGAITQAFVAHTELVRQGREVSPPSSCEHCPMVWYHKLCQDIEGMAEKRVHSTILRRTEQLSDEEQTQIMAKYQGGTEDLYEVGEHNAFLMMLLRAHCEAKQQRHVHDTAENRSEFLNQYLGGSTIFMKAKRSLSSSFDHLLKRKATKEDLIPAAGVKKETSPSSTFPPRSGQDPPPVPPRIQTPSSPPSASPDTTREPSAQGETPGLNLQLQNGREYHESSPSPQLKSPMMDIFLKLGSSPSPKGHSPQRGREKDEATEAEHTGSWRQAMFNRITRDDCLDSDHLAVSDGGNTGLLRRSSFSGSHPEGDKLTSEDLRELWRKAINQVILLIRMEKENTRLRARQEVSAVKRIKLEYEDIGGCAHENSRVWDMLTAPRESRLSTKVDSQMLLQAIRHGVPRAKRGEVWYFLAEQFCLRTPPPDTRNFPLYNAPYEALLKQLTEHQHAILIDLGRTFPSHTYFSSPLGPGQLALFNLLKAYSLLDPEVGYCQGLSFVAGVLLLHLDEAEAFLMLRHLMFRRGLRKQYLPDMVALQIQLYQLSRLVRDHLPDLYDKFDQYDISPTLYAAPWVLTIFTSQFPLGFVTRVFDLLFLESSEVIFRVAFALLDIHKDGLMLCDSFEEIMEYLKHKIPNIDKVMLDKVIKLAFTLDLSKQLHEYQVEYNVLQEEMAAIAPKMAELSRLQAEQKRLAIKNQQLAQQYEEAMANSAALQSSQSKLENQVKSLEQTVASLARYIGTTHDKKKDSELPNDIRRLCQQVQQTDRKTLGALGQKLGQNFASKFALTDLTSAAKISEESGSDPDDKNADKSKKIILKTGLSTPNLFNKISEAKKEELKMAAKTDAELEKKRQYLSMKKSYSCNAGLMAKEPPKEQSITSKIAANLKGYPLRVLDEDSEYNDLIEKPNKNLEMLKSSNLSDASSISSVSSSGRLGENLMQNMDSPRAKGSFFAHSHEQIRQEKLQAEQLKRDFDENLRRLDARLSPNVSFTDKSTGSLNPSEVTKKLNEFDQFNYDKKSSKSNTDSGIGTPISPNEKSLTSPKTEDHINHDVAVNHPLIGCDLDIKFDVHASKLKSIRPLKVLSVGTRASSDNASSRN